jgi:hypothetical protein
MNWIKKHWIKANKPTTLLDKLQNMDQRKQPRPWDYGFDLVIGVWAAFFLLSMIALAIYAAQILL